MLGAQHNVLLLGCWLATLAWPCASRSLPRGPIQNAGITLKRLLEPADDLGRVPTEELFLMRTTELDLGHEEAVPAGSFVLKTLWLGLDRFLYGSIRSGIPGGVRLWATN